MLHPGVRLRNVQTGPMERRRRSVQSGPTRLKEGKNVKLTERVATKSISTATLLFLSAALATPALSQSGNGSPQDAPNKSLVYDVVSVKPSQPGCPGMQMSGSTGRIAHHCVTLWGLMYNAYDLRPNDTNIPGLPGWAMTAQFDVDAKMDDDTIAALQKLPGEDKQKQIQFMLQALLADRFKLRVHTETRDRPIYALVIAKGGSKLKPLPADAKQKGSSWGNGRIQLQAGPIDRLAFCLSDGLDKVVVDKTGLTGKYDITLTWTPDDRQGTADAGPTLFTALEEQLGLKLESTRGPVDTLVVDHAEKPSEN